MPIFAMEPSSSKPELTYYSDDDRHLVCIPYSEENLHLMAERLGIKRHWFHRGRLAHYDIPLRRTLEIGAKTIRVTVRQVLSIIKGTFKNNELSASSVEVPTSKVE